MNNLNWKAWLAFFSVCFFWGTTYLAIRIGVKNFPPFLFVAIRQLTAGLILLSYFVVIKKEKLPNSKELFRICLAGAFFILGANTLMTWSEVYISSGLAALLATFLPFYILFINFILGKVEKLNFYGYIGLILGAVGMVLIFYDSIQDLFEPNYLKGICFIVLASMSWAIGSVYMKNTEIKTISIFASSIQMVTMGTIILCISLSTEQYTNLDVNIKNFYALGYLIVFGSIIGYGSFIYSVSLFPSTFFSIYAYINTLVAVILGVIILNEKITLFTIFSICLTILGVFLVGKGYAKKE